METRSPRALGFRWPAEWEPHAATWLSWPHNEETWPGRLPAVRLAFATMAAALVGREELRINVGSEPLEEQARETLRAHGVDPDRGIRFFRIPTDDAWVRDYGPIFVVRGSGEDRERAVVDFDFDAWGRKYPPWYHDARVARRIASELGVARFESSLVLEGGSIDGNGQGVVLTTESCLLNPNRDPARVARDREAIENLLADFVGARQVLWLGDGIEGDDTDGHIDDLTRFVSVDTIVTSVESDSTDANFAPLRENSQRLRELRDAAGRPFQIVDLPMPPAVVVDGLRCPASYANFYLANGVALVPTFATTSDERALALLRELLPDREVVPIPSRDLVVGLGAVHCLTQSEPR